MFKAFGQMFMALFTLFQAAEKSARALDHLATYAEESAQHFNDEARIERKQRLAKLTEE